ncbi:MAG: BACON domain-containing protein, partial [Bacteroidales bacterium]
ANVSAEERMASITITAGERVENVTVIQEGKTLVDPIFIVAPLSLSFLQVGENKNITIISNLAWTVSSSAEWCTVDKVSGESSSEVLITTMANTSSKARAAVVTITANGESKTVNVEQLGLSVLTPTLNIVSADKISLDNGMVLEHIITTIEENLIETTVFTLSANAPDWISLNGNKLTGITPDANTDITITIIATNGEIAATQALNIKIGPLAAWIFESATDLDADWGSGVITRSISTSLNYTATTANYIFCNGWNNEAGEYWLLRMTTPREIYGSINITFKSSGSNTGPKNWKLQASLDNETWIDGDAYEVKNSTATAQISFNLNVNLPTLIVVGHPLYLRLITTDLVSIGGANVTAGNNRLADIAVR